jgi:hypothetical protein
MHFCCFYLFMMCYVIYQIYVRLHREWLFNESSEGPILTNPIQNFSPAEYIAIGKKRMVVHHSPLIQMFIEPLKLSSSEPPLNLTMSQNPARMLNVILPAKQSELPAITTQMRIREDTIDHATARKIVGKALRARNSRMDDYNRSTTNLGRSIHKIRKNLAEELQTLRLSQKIPKLARTVSAISAYNSHHDSTSLSPHNNDIIK